MKRTGQWHVWCQHAKGYVCACVCVCGQMGYNLEQETFVVLEGQCCVCIVGICACVCFSLAFCMWTKIVSVVSDWNRCPNIPTHAVKQSV